MVKLPLKRVALELRQRGSQIEGLYIVLAGLVFYDKITCCGDNSVLIYIAIHL